MRRDSYRFAAQDFVCSGDDGLAPAGMTMRAKTGSHVCLPLPLLPGIITWTRYQVLLSRIQANKPHWKRLVFQGFQRWKPSEKKLTIVMEERPFENSWEVSQLDQKLLWAELDEEQSGAEAWLKEALKHQNWKWNERDEKEEISWTFAIFCWLQTDGLAMRSLSITLSWLLLNWNKLLWNPFCKTTVRRVGGQRSQKHRSCHPASNFWRVSCWAPTFFDATFCFLISLGSGYSSSCWFPFSICSDCFEKRFP